MRWDFRSVSAGTEVATKTKQREPTVPITTTAAAAAKCCTDHRCVAMGIDRQLQLDAHTGKTAKYKFLACMVKWYISQKPNNPDFCFAIVVAVTKGQTNIKSKTIYKINFGGQNQYP